MNKKELRLLVLRIVLGVLILANLTAIFLFSSQSGEASGNTSRGVSYFLARLFTPNYDTLSHAEQTDIIHSIHPIVRKIAHMAEFGLLGALIFSFLLTWRGKLPLQYADALLLTFAVACIDELGQSCSQGRSSQFTDVLIDLSGAILTCSALLLLMYLLHRHRNKAKDSV